MNTKIKSSTIIETIVALVLLLIAFGVASYFIAATYTDTGSTLRLRAETALSNFIMEARVNNWTESKEIEMDGFIINLSLSSYSDNPFLKQFVYTVRKDGKLLVEKKEITRLYDE